MPKKTIQIYNLLKCEMVTVDCIFVGPHNEFAIHHTLASEGLSDTWTVTLTHTKESVVTYIRTRKEAKACAQELLDTGCPWLQFQSNQICGLATLEQRTRIRAIRRKYAG